MVTSELGACEWFVWDLRRSNLLDRGRLDQIVGEFLQKNNRAEPPALAEFLVGQGILTQFQAERLLQGKTQGFVLGPFVLMDALGAGSMGTVYKAQSKNDNAWYAVKVLPRRSMWNVRLARRKVRAFEQCRHGAVVPFVDVGTSGGMHYLAWPLVEGESLEKFVQSKGRLSPGQAAHIAQQIAEGLDVCHQQGLIHGLIKPSNIMIGEDVDQVFILDFGIGCLLAETEGESLVDTMSTANAVASGLDCASPESIMEPTNLTPPGDQYSLGCTLYYMLTGQYPFPDGSAAEKMMAHQFKQPTPILDLNPDVPVGLVEVVARLMQKAPEQRFGAASEVVESLKPFARTKSHASAGSTPRMATLRPTTPKPSSGIHMQSPGIPMKPSVSSHTPAPVPAPRSGILGGVANPSTPRAPSTPLPKAPQMGNLPPRPQTMSGVAARPATMQALPTRDTLKVTPASPNLPTPLPADPIPATHVPIDEPARPLDERIGAVGVAMLATLVCCSVFFAARYLGLF